MIVNDYTEKVKHGYRGQKFLKTCAANVQHLVVQNGAKQT